MFKMVKSVLSFGTNVSKKAVSVVCKGGKALLVMVGLGSVAGVASASDPLIPDVGVDMAGLITEAGTTVGGYVGPILGVACAFLAVVAGYRFLKRTAHP